MILQCLAMHSFRMRSWFSLGHIDLAIAECFDDLEDFVPSRERSAAKPHVAFHGEGEFDLGHGEARAGKVFLISCIGEFGHGVFIGVS